MGINFQKVNFAYYIPKKKQVINYTLKNVNLNINSTNEFISIVGHTGSGKSTIVQLMNALLIPTTGSVDILGNIVTNNYKIKLKPIRKGVGLVFQFPEYQIFESSVIKDIMFGPKNFGLNEQEAKDKAYEVAQIMGIDEELLQRNPFSLSGGQMRKVAIAGILASNPEILILDEPTVGLDPLARKELLEFLKELNEQGKTIIIITHDMEVVSKYCKRVIVLKTGEIVVDTSKDKLFSESGLLEKYSLDYPAIMSLLIKIRKKFNLDIDVVKFTVDEAYKELKKAFGDKNEW